MFVAGLAIANAQDCNSCMSKMPTNIPTTGKTEDIMSYCNGMKAFVDCVAGCPDLASSIAQAVSGAQGTLNGMCKEMSGNPGAGMGGGQGGGDASSCTSQATNCFGMLGGDPNTMTKEQKCPNVPKVEECMMKIKDCESDPGYAQMLPLFNAQKSLCSGYKTESEEKAGDSNVETKADTVSDDDGDGENAAGAAYASTLLLSAASVFVLTLF